MDNKLEGESLNSSFMQDDKPLVSRELSKYEQVESSIRLNIQIFKRLFNKTDMTKDYKLEQLNMLQEEIKNALCTIVTDNESKLYLTLLKVSSNLKEIEAILNSSDPSEKLKQASFILTQCIISLSSDHMDNSSFTMGNYPNRQGSESLDQSYSEREPEALYQRK